MGSNESYLVMEFMLIDDMILSMLHNKPRLWRLNKSGPFSKRVRNWRD